MLRFLGRSSGVAAGEKSRDAQRESSKKKPRPKMTPRRPEIGEVNDALTIYN
jgi:hypothetical protein